MLNQELEPIHPVDKILAQQTTIGERVADKVIGFMGSWGFITLQTIIVSIWVIGNTFFLIFRFDPAPFILLNLVFAAQSAYAAPLILLSGNRSSRVDRMVRDYEARLLDEEDAQTDRIEEMVKEILTRMKAL